MTVIGIAPTNVQRTLNQLRAVCEHRALPELAGELDRLGSGLESDLSRIEAALARVPRGEDPGPVERSARHLLALGGKRLRPLLVLLAARLGHELLNNAAAAREVAVAVELVHGATLLHDDVVDLGETRRGAKAARVLYGNAASIFAGDWLLVEALRRVRAARIPGVIDRLLGVIEEMILAESLQLARRGRIEADRAAYFRIIEGKTASLFAFAAHAGARAGGLGDRETAALDAFGKHLGVAFQAIDDALDLAGDAGTVKKTLFADLREGKMTYPLIVALERDGSGELERLLAAIVADDGAELDRRKIAALLAETDAIRATQDLAREHARSAKEALSPLQPSAERALLEVVVEAAVERSF
jgi:octaprenyl-diphosphate synthase